MKMKKGLLLATTPLSHDGLTGIELDILAYNKEMIEFDLACGFEITDEFKAKLDDLGVKTHSLPNKKLTIKYMHEIWKLAKQEKYDFVYIHGNSSMMLIEAMPSKIAGAKIITHCHNTKSNYPLINKMFKPVFNLCVDKKIGCSMLASEWAYSGKNVITIKNGVNIEKFQFDNVARNSVRKYLGWESNTIIGHIGRFIDQKNHERLLEIFEYMYRRNSNYRLLLIGDGELRSNIEGKISDKKLDNIVKIVEYTDTPEQFMSAMDIMVIPSLFEGLCLVAIEAQANGLPVLIDTYFSEETSATDICERIDLSEKNDVWAMKIESMLTKGRRNVTRQLIQKQFDKETMMKSIHNILLE